jgi:predicted TIM-barrel fold metal-dependent hydrolase
MTSQTETEGRIYYTESDRIIWEEELDSFVPARFFDAHSHLWTDDCLPADHPGRGTSPLSDMRTMTEWNARLFPGRHIEYLALGMPVPGMDVAVYNRFQAAELKPYHNYRMHRLVTPRCTPDEIRADVRNYGYTGLKPYRLFSVTGDVNRCRIHEFLTHPQLELANELGLWVTMHLSRYHGCADEQNLQDLEEYTTRRYPRVRWILAHCARSFTYWPIRQAIDRLRSLPNIWYDTSAVTDVMPHATLFKKEDHRRILFGTDDMVANAFHGKYITMGRFWYQMETPEVAKKPEIHTDSRPVLSIYDQLLAMKLAAELAELTRQQIEDIFYNNARDAFGLEPAAAAGTARD